MNDLNLNLEHNLCPQDIVQELDKYIIGQKNAKIAVAIALRNRIRRMQVPENLRSEITPKNILMIGPTGVGKTEIARRLAKLANAPFIKVEATKFTEIGYVGRDVESIIRDLVDVAYKLIKEEYLVKVRERAEMRAKEKVLDILLQNARKKTSNEDLQAQEEHNVARNVLREKLDNHELDNKEIDIEISRSIVGIEIMAPPGMEEMSYQLQNLFQNLSQEKTKQRKMTVAEAIKFLKEDEATRLVNEEDLRNSVIMRVEQTGIVFIDEIDKITQRSERTNGGEVSREGVQRDLLPLIEGSSVSTKYGMVRTDHILFIASGAFHLSKPSDLVPELQGRLPIRVELDALSVEDFKRILTEPDANLTIQHAALLATENVKLKFTNDAIEEISRLAYSINERTENIGARRLYTIMEKLLEDISFNATDHKGQSIKIDKKYVVDKLQDICKNEDLSKFIL